MSKYPSNKLGDICTIKTGKKDANFGTDDGQYAFFTCGEKILKAPDYSFNTDAILIAGNGDVGACKKYKGKFEAYQRTYVLDDFQGVNKDFLFYYLNGNLKRLLLQETFGSAIPYIKLGSLKERIIPLPPLPTQKAIVAKLDEAFENIDKQIEELRGNIEDVEKVRQSGLFGAFSNNGYVAKKLSEMARVINGRAYKKNELLSSGAVPVLRVGNLFTSKTWYYSDLELGEDKYISPGDLIYAWSASFGPFIWKGEKAIYHYHIWKIVCSELVNKKYLYLFLLFATDELKGGGNGVGMIHITKGMMEKLEIPLPPPSIQKEIVSHLDLVFEKNAALKSQYEEQIIDLKKLKQSLLTEAFEGRLVN